MIKVVYLDIDGTLRDERYGIPRSALWAIEQCRKQAIRVIICTGRNQASIQDDVRAIAGDGVISGGGSLIRLSGGQCRKQKFAPEVLETFVRSAKERGMFLALESDRNIYMDECAVRFYETDLKTKFPKATRQELKEIKRRNKVHYQANFPAQISDIEDIHKICVWGRQDRLSGLLADFSGQAEAAQKRRWNQSWYMELMPKGCNKGTAVRWVNRQLGVSREDSMSFGDSDNDMEMLRETGTSVVLGNGTPAAKAAADSVCEPLLEDGLFKELVRRNIISKRMESI